MKMVKKFFITNYIYIIDNTNKLGNKISKSTFDIHYKKRVEIKKEDVFEIYNILNTKNSKLWFTGFLVNREVFNVYDEDILTMDDEDIIKLLITSVSIENLSILRVWIYSLENGDYLFKFDDDYFLVKNKDLKEFLSNKLKEYILFWSENYPKLKKYL